MEYKGIRYSVGETVGAACRWTVSLTTGERVGEARNRQLAIIKAIKVIDEDQRKIRAILRKAAAQTRAIVHRPAERNLPLPFCISKTCPGIFSRPQRESKHR
jgi:hypothetical protein